MNSSNNSYLGSLRVRATVAEDAVPLRGVNVLIKGESADNADVIYSVVTDRDGLTALISLPAIPTADTLTPGGADGKEEVYSVTASADGYYAVNIKGVPLYEGVVTLLPINMIPFENGARPEVGLDVAIPNTFPQRRN